MAGPVHFCYEWYPMSFALDQGGGPAAARMHRAHAAGTVKCFVVGCPRSGTTLISVIQILFLLTPILWSADQLDNKLVVELNPLYHLIEMIRAPLLGHVPLAQTWGVALGVTALGWLVTLTFFVRFRERIAYWI